MKKAKMFSGSKKVCAVFLVCCLLATVLLAAPFTVSAAKVTGAKFAYDDTMFTATDNGDGTQTLTAIAEVPWYKLTTRTDGINCIDKGAHFVISNLVIDDSSKYTFVADFGNNWNYDQNFDKCGFLFTYSSDGDLRILANHTSYDPAEGDTTAVHETIEPLTKSGFELDIRCVGNKFVLRVTSSAGKVHNYVYDTTYAVENSPNGAFDRFDAIVYAFGLNHCLNNSGGAAAGTSFTVKRTDATNIGIEYQYTQAGYFSANTSQGVIVDKADGYKKFFATSRMDSYFGLCDWNMVSHTGDGVRYSFRNLDITPDGSFPYSLHLNFGTTWKTQNVDKSGIALFYGSDGVLSVFANNGGFAADAAETTAINTTIAPLTSAGCDIDIRLIGANYNITVTNGGNKYSFVYDTSYATNKYSDLYNSLENPSVRIGVSGLVWNRYTKAGSSFDFKISTVAADYSAVPGCVNQALEGYYYSTDSKGHLVVGHDSKGNNSNRITITETDKSGAAVLDKDNKKIYKQFDLLSDEGLTINLTDISSYKTDDFSIVIGLTGAGANPSWWDADNSLIMYIDRDGDIAIGATDGTTYKLPGKVDPLGSAAGSGTIDSISINIKGTTANDGQLFFEINGKKFTTKMTLSNWQTYVSIGIASSFSLADFADGTLTDFLCWQAYTGSYGSRQNIANRQSVSYTISEISDGSTDVGSIVLDQQDLEIYPHQSVQINATVKPSSALDKTLTWTSSDDTVATVDANGLVTGVGYGTAIITAESVNGVTAACNVYVYPTGDIDGDEEIGVFDLIDLRKGIFDNDQIENIYAYDVHYDGKINVLDLIAMKKIIVNS